MQYSDEKENSNLKINESVKLFRNVNENYGNNTHHLKQISPINKKISSFYNRVNTSPVKKSQAQFLNKLQQEQEQDFGNFKTIAKKDILSAPLCQSDEKTRDKSLYTFENDEKFNRFTSNSEVKKRINYLISEGEWPEKKPALNNLESRNKLIEYSKKKGLKFEIKEDFCGGKRKNTEDVNKNETNIQREENKQCENEDEDEYEYENDEEFHRLKRLSEIESNLPVPISKKNDEIFKLKKMKQMRRKSLANNKSARACEIDTFQSRKHEILEVLDYSLCKKKKVTHSTKRIYSSLLTLEDPAVNLKKGKNKKKSKLTHKFPVYRDNEIGINEYWQAPLIESKADEDIPTDDEQLMLAGHYTVNEISEAIEIFLSEGAYCLRNKNFITLPTTLA